MLKALREDGSLLQLLPRISSDELRKEKASNRFYCPECKERVVMKIGTQRIEHFAHEAGSLCVESYERESTYHLNGKLQLYQWLESQRLRPKLEPYYEKLKQRPDLSICFSNKEYALEFQCSTIPPGLMIKRSNTYLKNLVNPVWVLGGNEIKRKGTKKVSLSKFNYLFLNKNSSGNWYLPFYCSITKMFIFLINIIPISSKNAFAQFSINPIQKCSFEQLLSPHLNGSITSEVWRNEMRAQKLGIQTYGKHYLPFLKELYSHNVVLSLLPAFIGIPIQNAPIIETSPLIWQSYLFIDVLINKNPNDLITFGEVYRSLMDRVHHGQIKLRNLPLIQNCNPTLPLADYLKLLVKLQVLEAVNQNTFRVKKEMMIPEHFVAQQRLEDQFYKKFSTLIV